MTPKKESDSHVKIPEPTITPNILHNEKNFNERNFSEELESNNQISASDNSTASLYNAEKKLKKTLETMGLHLVETKIDDISAGEQKEEKLGRKIKRNESNKQRDDSEPLTMVETKK